MWLSTALSLLALSASLARAVERPAPAQCVGLSGDGQSRDGRPLLCGAQCVYSAQRWYRGHDDLAVIARETNDRYDWPATLAAMEAALNRRGIHTLTIRVRPNTKVRWPYPIVVHLETLDRSAAHFSLWTPGPPAEECPAWSGRENKEGRLGLRPSGVLLLTSPAAIEESAVEVSGPEDFHRQVWQALAGVTAALPLVVCCLVARTTHRARALDES
jgi:hypothetical protein